MKIAKKHKAWLILLVLLAVPTISFAQIWTGPAGTSTCNLAGSDPCDLCDLAIVAANTYWLIVQMVLVLGIIFIIAGAIIMLSGAFSPSWHEMGKSAITWAIIGIAVAILSWVLINTVFYFLADEEYRGWGTIDCTMFDFLTAVPSAPPIVPPPPTEPPPTELPTTGPLRADCVGVVLLSEGCLEIRSGETPSLGTLSLHQDPPNPPLDGALIIWDDGPAGAVSGNRVTGFALVTETEITVRLVASPDFGGREFLGWSNTTGDCEFDDPTGPRNQLAITCTYSTKVIGATAWYREAVVPTLTLQQLAQYFLDNNVCDEYGMSCGATSDPEERVGPCDNLRETVNGESLTVCSPGCTPSSGCAKDSSVTLDIRLLQALYDLRQAGFTFTITSLTTGPHMEGSNHYRGIAADLWREDGEYDSMTAFLRDLGIFVYEEGSHIHVDTRNL